MQDNTQSYIWLDGAFVRWKDAKAHLMSHGMQYGSSVFEGVRAYETKHKGVCIYRHFDHIQRLFNSARIYDTTPSYSIEEIMEACRQTVRKNQFTNCYLRPIISAAHTDMGPGAPCDRPSVAIAAFASSATTYPTGPKQSIRVGISSWRRPPPGTIPTGAKASGNYLSSRLISLEGKRNGFEDAIALTHDGLVSEAHASNIFIVVNQKIFTPSADCGILMGITRDSILVLANQAGFHVYERPITREMLCNADEVFLTGTAGEITPVSSVSGIKVGSGGFPICDRLTMMYFEQFAVSNHLSDGWLDPVE